MNARFNDLLQAWAAPLRDRGRDWILGLAGAMLVVHLVRLPLPAMLGGLIGFAALFLLSGVAFNAGVEALRVAAAGPGGRGAPRAITGHSEGMATRLIALWLLMTLVVVAATQLAGTFGMLLGLAFAAVAMPSATLVLVLDNSLIEALYPPKAIRLAARIGRQDHGALVALIAASAVIYLLVAAILTGLGLPPIFRAPIQFGLWVWFVLAWFRAAGDALWRHRDALNLVEADTEPEARREPFTRDPDALWEQIRTQGGTREMHAELARQLARSSDRVRRLEHGKLHIQALLFSFEDAPEALDRAAAFLQLEPSFRLDQPDPMFALIRASAEAGNDWLTGALCRNYLAAFSYSVKCNEVRLIGCEALAGDRTNARGQADQWYRELMTAELKPEQRRRLKALAGAYLNHPSTRKAAGPE